jgi:hypothetical protein
MTAARPLQAIGFWFSDFEPELPRPDLLVGAGYDENVRSTLLRYLERGQVFQSYRGHSSCRFRCGVPSEQMGSRDFTDGQWVWPEGLSHYIRRHDIPLPAEFVSVALTERAPDAPSTREVRRDLWLDWTRARGAAVDVSPPWHLIAKREESWPEIQNLEAELKRELGPSHPLAYAPIELLARRHDRDDVLVRVLGSSRLALVHLTWSGREERDGYPRTKLFETWAQWNVHRSAEDDPD